MSVGLATRRALATAYGVVVERLRRQKLVREYLLRRSPIGYWLAGLARRGLMAGSGSTVSVPEGFLMHLDARDNYGIQFLAGNYEPGVTAVVKNLLKPGACFVDVGAHHGYYSLMASRLVLPGGCVLAFEPEPSNFARLQDNVALNHSSNVVAIQGAVGQHVGTATLHVADRGNSGSHSLAANVDTVAQIEVPLTTLDTVLDSMGWPTVSLVKIDAEGAELIVLSGMAELIHRNPALCVVLEFFPRALHAMCIDPRVAYSQLLAAFSDVRRIDDRAGLVDADLDWMLARSDAVLSADNLLLRGPRS